MARGTVLSSNGTPLDLSDAALGELAPADDLIADGAGLRARLAERGYLFFRGLLPRETVLAARREILLKYATVGEIDSINHPLLDAVRSETSFIDQVNLRAFTESVRTGLAYERVVLHDRLIALMESVLEGAVRPFDFRWPRFVRPGEACGFHYDGPYMNRGADRILTSWIPLGDIAPEEGALLILEGSHTCERLLTTYAKRDADKEKISWLGEDPNRLRASFGGRWLTADFRMGDVLVFGMHMLHGAFDNRSPEGRCRLSSDTRYQRADAPADERWNGSTPEAHGYDKVFLPGLGRWNNREFHDEWKPVDALGRLVIPD
ncbi:MAG: phytanoyl-CoA dioxygenase family protein [Caulobacterales bacterium]|nr:phytanoyl-CoA dioxygenase family protein [Caulobacterales bacterium]